MKRYDFINALIKKNKYKTYLEIGVRDNRCFDKIKIKDKSGVDPMQDDWEKKMQKEWNHEKVLVKYRMTSDDYFSKHNHKYDIIFIDGLHENEQVYRDIQNSLKCLNPNGSIIMHDCLPLKEEHQNVPRISNYWNGDVWKAFVRVRNERTDVEMSVIDTDCGLGFIQFKDIQIPAIWGQVKLDWKNYQKNKKNWMNIKSVSEIVKEMGEENFVNQRVQSFLHSGSLGDVIFSLPLIIKKGGGDIYLKNKHQFSAINKQYQSLYRLLKSQPYINNVNLYKDEYGIKTFREGSANEINTDVNVKYDNTIELDYDLDYFRMSPKLFEEQLVFSYFRVWKENPANTPFPYLILKENYKFKTPELNNNVKIPNEKFNVFHITQRYRDGVDYDWEKCIKSQKNKNYYTGLKSEYDAFIKEYNVEDYIIFYGDKVKDLYDMAWMIQKCDNFYCNPSSPHALAMALNKKFHIAINPDIKNVLTGMPNEVVLN